MRYQGADGRAAALRLIAECRDAQNTTLDLSSLRLTLLEPDVVAGLTSLTAWSIGSDLVILKVEAGE